jgi:hypothetical protein
VTIYRPLVKIIINVDSNLQVSFRNIDYTSIA